MVAAPEDLPSLADLEPTDEPLGGEGMDELMRAVKQGRVEWFSDEAEGGKW